MKTPDSGSHVTCLKCKKLDNHVPTKSKSKRIIIEKATVVIGCPDSAQYGFTRNPTFKFDSAIAVDASAVCKPSATLILIRCTIINNNNNNNNDNNNNQVSTKIMGSYNKILRLKIKSQRKLTGLASAK